MENMYDLIIIGAGPIGLTCGIEAKKQGINYLILDKGALVNSIFHFPANMTFFSTSKLLEIGEVPFISHADKPKRSEALEYFRRVFESWNLNAKFYECVVQVDRTADHHFQVETSKNTYTTKFIIVSTGFYDYPRMMHIPGEELPKVKHYYDEAHPYVKQKVAVIGSANSACDVALELHHKEAEVTMIIRGPSINDRVKYWIKPNIENRIKEGSIKAYFNSQVKEIRTREIVVETEEGELILENDFVLAMTGYQPDFSFLSSMGITFDESDQRKIEYDPESHETKVQGIYVAGVVCGGLKTNRFFIENAKDHSERIIGDILSKMNILHPN